MMKKLRDALIVDKYMLPAKIAYFFTTGQDAAFRPYMMSFLIGIGLNQAEAGFVTGKNNPCKQVL